MCGRNMLPKLSRKIVLCAKASLSPKSVTSMLPFSSVFVYQTTFIPAITADQDWCHGQRQVKGICFYWPSPLDSVIGPKLTIRPANSLCSRIGCKEFRQNPVIILRSFSSSFKMI